MFYLELFRELEASKVRYLLVGGLAMNLHGVPRMTMDVDIILAMDEPNLQAFLKAANHLGLQPVAPVKKEDLLNPSARKSWVTEKHMVAFALRPSDPVGPTIDVLIDPSINIAEALKRAESKVIGGVHVSLATVEDMIVLKRAAGRKQDLADIRQLEMLRQQPK
ncbi:MAG: nucleotidyltransferase [Gammaproteobacteria bacterium]|nr:nucleotidyltransferase [Gammaproteobacteria bacterium]